MQIRAPKSIGFGVKRAEKSPYKRTIPYDASLGPSGRRFDPCHSDQNFDRKQSLFSAFGHFLCLFRYFTATFEKIAFLRPHHQMWADNFFFFVYSGAKISHALLDFWLGFVVRDRQNGNLPACRYKISFLIIKANLFPNP